MSYPQHPTHAVCAWCSTLMPVGWMEPVEPGSDALACMNWPECQNRQTARLAVRDAETAAIIRAAEAQTDEMIRQLVSAARCAEVRAMIELRGWADEIDTEAKRLVSAALAAEGVNI